MIPSSCFVGPPVVVNPGVSGFVVVESIGVGDGAGDGGALDRDDLEHDLHRVRALLLREHLDRHDELTVVESFRVLPGYLREDEVHVRAG